MLNHDLGSYVEMDQRLGYIAGLEQDRYFTPPAFNHPYREDIEWVIEGTRADTNLLIHGNGAESVVLARKFNRKNIIVPKVGEEIKL